MSAINSPNSLNQQMNKQATTPSSQSKRNKKRNKNKNKQSINSPTSQSVVEEIEQPNEQQIDYSNKFDKDIQVIEPVKVNEYSNELKSQPITQPIDLPVGQTTTQRLDQTTSQSINQPISQPIGQTNHVHDTNKLDVLSADQSLHNPSLDNHSTDRLSSGSVSDEPVAMVANMSVNQAGSQDWLLTQGKTFLRWCNYYLSQRDLKAESIGKSFQDGNLLINLIEILSGAKLSKRAALQSSKQINKPLSQVQRLDNLAIAFRFLEENEKMKLVNLRINDIESGNEKMTMALIWSLIVHWQIEKIARMVKQRKLEAAEAAKKAAEQSHSQSSIEEPLVDAVPLLADTAAVSAKSELLSWVNSKVLLYDVKPVRDFTSSFTDGTALAALTDALLVEQARLLSVMKNNAIEHEAEKVTEDGKKILDLPSDPLACVNAAIVRAENELRIPPLIDAADLVHNPHEQAVMTYIACFRDREQTLATIGHEAAVELPVVEAEPAEVLAVVTDEQAPLDENELIDHQTINQPLEPVVESKAEEEMLSLSNDASVDESAPVVERVDVAPLATSEQPEHVESVEIVTTPLALRTAEMDIEPAAASAYNPPGTPTHVVSARGSLIDQSADQSIDQSGDHSIDDDEQKHEPAGFVAAQQFQPVEEEMKQTEPPQQQEAFQPVVNTAPVDKSNTVTEVDVCMTNSDLQYVQARPDGSVIVDAANSSWSVWTVIDEQGTDTVFFRDHTGRYMTSSPDGSSVRMGPKTELSRWHVTRGKQQKFQNLANLYLTAREGFVTCEPAPSMHANLTLNFPVIEGYLKKKGSSGLKRWQSRYFAFNGAVMSYWSRKEEAGVNRIPKGVYYPKHIASLELEKNDPSKFSIKFSDDKVVVLDASTPAEAQRWIHSLEMTGVKVQ